MNLKIRSILAEKENEIDHLENKHKIVYENHRFLQIKYENICQELEQVKLKNFNLKNKNHSV